MRTHSKIISDAAGPHAVARKIAPHLTVDEITIQKRVRQWLVAKSIPGEYWVLLERLGIATIEELGCEAAGRKGVSLPANDARPHEEAA